MAGRIRYSDAQLAAVRAVIARLPSLSPADIAGRNAAVTAGKCPVACWPLWPLAAADPALWDVIIADARLPEFSVYGFFPAAYDLVYGAAGPPAAIRYAGRTRGSVAIISGQRRGAPVAVVIKPCQSPAEAAIAAIAGELGIGPAQLPGIAGFISEEFVAGPFLTDLTSPSASPARMRAVGTALATALRRLHAAGICYNDATISDPEGRSHVICQPDGGLRLIDFGVALLLRDHPQGLTFHDAYNAARTDPMFRLFRLMTPAEPMPTTDPVAPTDPWLDESAATAGRLGEFVAGYGRWLAGQTAERIQSRDWRIATEGSSIIAARFGPAAAAALREGLSTG